MSSITHLFLALICAASLLFAHAADEVSLPSSFKICNHKQSNYSACLRESLQEAWPTIVNGIPELGVPKLDPFKFDPFKYDYQLGLISSHLEIRNVTTYGLSKTIFRAVRPTRTADRMNIQVDFKLPKTFTDGYYVSKTNIGPIKILGGQGYFNQTTENFPVTIGLEGRIENDRWVIEHSRLALNPISLLKAKVKFYFEDLFNGNQILNKAVRTLFNNFWPLWYLGLQSTVMKDWDAMMTNVANRILSKLSFSKTFP